MAQTASLSVLVVDDERFVRETLGEMLEDLDHKVVMVDGGREAVEKVTNEILIWSLRIWRCLKWMVGRQRARFESSAPGCPWSWSQAMAQLLSRLRENSIWLRASSVSRLTSNR